ncbi:MAG: tetratricopeptide repeat protein [Simkaniaceae bacterium]|nr:tetratricopeptide repeat protein [Simkaniaceae bacterium]
MKDNSSGIDSFCLGSLSDFKRVVRLYFLFHAAFILLFTLEVTLFFTFLIISPRSLEMGISLASFVLTAFTYMVLLFYMQTKKPLQLKSVERKFMHGCSSTLPPTMNTNDYHLFLAHAAFRLATTIDAHTDIFDSLPLSFRVLFVKFSEWLHRSDVIFMKQHLLRSSIDHHLSLLKHDPTNIEVHGSLANTYLAFAEINRGSISVDAVKRAIEEFLIIDHFAPDSPWVQAQLANCYHLIKDPLKERSCYETILNLNPNDKEILFRLGVLYFEQHLFAKGLEIYDHLRRFQPQKAEELISFYHQESETL